MFAGAGMMAADGRCKTLDAAADGYVRGEACVVIKLRWVLAMIQAQKLPFDNEAPHMALQGGWTRRRTT